MPRILVIDDQPENLDVTARRLRLRGYEVAEAGSGESGIVAARSDRPDLILMDIQMPGVDGHEATRRLKADPQTAAIPVIALTANAFDEDRKKALAAGADEYESKPVEMDRLLAKMRALLGRAGT
jgi:CheY-like chemotaxis protein